jgi:outer membrane biosynthesis protein TonB
MKKKKAKTSTAKKHAAKPAAKKSARPAAKASARPAAKKSGASSGGTYTPQPIQGIGWAPFRYPLT